MGYDKDGVLQFVEENDVKFIRLVFSDIFGVPKNVAITAEQLPHVLEHGAGFDVSALDGFLNLAESDLLLFPDPASLSVLPWRPSTGRVARMYCDIRHPGGQAFIGCNRTLLRQTVKKAAMQGLTFRFGTECEFYLFQQDENGAPTLTPQDDAGYLDIAPLDKGENVRRDICLALDDMGLYPQGSHHEKGPGQNEIWCSATDPLRCADDFITYKSVVRTIAAGFGLFASFMPKPLADKSGSGLHINISMSRDGGTVDAQNPLFVSFMGGVLQNVGDMALFLNSTTNSYRRFGSFDAPKFISWSHGNRAQLLRVPEARTGGNARMELRSPDALCNPYLAFTLLLEAGLAGIKNGTQPGAETTINLMHAERAVQEQYATLPDTLGEAILRAEGSGFIQASLPGRVAEQIVACKQKEWASYLSAGDTTGFELERYFAMT